jgi:thiamine-phosphate pyrophosphorylase
VSRLDFFLYLITDGESDADARVLAALRAVPAGSVAVQLRNKGTGGAALLRVAERLREITRAHAAPLFINDRLDVALAVDADGVHLPGHGLPAAAVRGLLGDRLRIVCAAHSLAEAEASFLAGADAVTFSPIWPTPSKPDDPAVPEHARVFPVGIAALGEAVAALPGPVFALGGVDTEERAAECASVGARIACLRAVLGAADPGQAAAAFLAAVTKAA